MLYINNSNFKDNNQFSYRPKHKCSDAVLLARHTIEQKLTQSKFVLAILIDLTAAFECLDTETILPSKLKFYGVDSKAQSFFSSFFKNRKHFVQWNESKSSTKDLFNLSCVQGSCMGPSIFNTFSTTQNSHIPRQSLMIVEDAKRQNLNLYSLMAE